MNKDTVEMLKVIENNYRKANNEYNNMLAKKQKRNNRIEVLNYFLISCFIIYALVFLAYGI